MSCFNNFSLTVMLGAAFAVFTFAHSALPQTSSPIEEFKALGWSAYSKTGKKYYPKKRYQYRTQKDDLVKALNPDLLKKLLGPSYQPFEELIDGDEYNDELDSIHVTNDNYLTLSVLTKTGRGFEIGGGERKYLLLKQVDQFTADAFRKASPYDKRK